MKGNLSLFTVELFGKLKGWIDPKFTAVDARLAKLEEKQRVLEGKLAALSKESGK